MASSDDIATITVDPARDRRTATVAAGAGRPVVYMRRRAIVTGFARREVRNVPPPMRQDIGADETAVLRGFAKGREDSLLIFSERWSA